MQTLRTLKKETPSARMKSRILETRVALWAAGVDAVGVSEMAAGVSDMEAALPQSAKKAGALGQSRVPIKAIGTFSQQIRLNCASIAAASCTNQIKAAVE
jgi:hypothetical protein